MANQKISQLPTITGASMEDDDKFVLVDTSADATVATTREEFFKNVPDVEWGDNQKAIFGSGSDLQIYSDGATSYIKESGSSNLKVQADDFYVFNAAGNSVMISALDTDKVGLGFAGVEKFKTTSTGIEVSGTVEADGLTVNGSSTGTLSNVNFLNTDTRPIRQLIV